MSLSINIDSLFCVVRDIGSTVTDQAGPDKVAGMVARKFIDTLGAKGATVVVSDPQTKDLRTMINEGSRCRPLFEEPGFWEARCRIVNRIDGSFLYVKSDEASRPEAAGNGEIKNVLDMPLGFQDGLIGFIRLYFDSLEEFSEEDENTLKIMLHQGACAMEKSRLIQRQQSDYHQLAASTEKMSALGRLSAGVAHEINNPLAGILLFSTNLLKKVPPDSNLKEGIEVIIREALRCKNIIQELLEFSREREPTRLNGNLNSIINKALVIVENECHLRHIVLEKKLAPDLPDSVLDPGQVEQVLVNLLLNAAQAVEEGGRIEIESRVNEEGNGLELVISDNGCGIEPRHLAKVFDPFYSTKPQGTGLGLAVSYGIVRNHKGDIRVASTPGKGTAFTVELPLNGTGTG